MDAVLFKAAARGREVQEKREAERRRALLVLILRHLTDHGYIEAAERLSTEANVTLCKYDAADNISLLQILQDFEEAQEQRYGKRPKLVKQLTCEVSTGGGGSRQVFRQSSQHQNTLGLVSNALCPAPPISGQLGAQQRREKAANAAASSQAPQQQQPGTVAGGKLPALSRSVSQTDKGGQHSSSNAKQEQQGQGSQGASANSSSTSSRQQSADGGTRPALEISGHGCEVGPSAGRGPKQKGSCSPDLSGDEEDTWAARLLKPLPTTLLGELRQLGAAISQDIYQESLNVKWSDIAGLTEAKRLLQESVGLPMRYPELFTGLLAPWRGVLLYGPPGTGKTLLAKAVATSCKTTFFNISASSIVSKWRGDSEKLVRVLFDLARHHAPATIFLDEVDALMGARGVEGEHEASRRMKTELLIQMDGLTRSSSSSSMGQQAEPQVFVLAASNLPWDLDQALLRRLQKRILVPLPDTEARHSMLQGLLEGRLDVGVQIDGLVQATDGYSGSDITLLAKEAAMRPLRRLLAVLEPSVYAGSTAAVGTAATAPSQPAGGTVPTAGAGAAASAIAAAAARASAGLTCTKPIAPGVAAGVAAAGRSAAGADGDQASLLELGPVTADDLSAALSVTKPSAQGYERQYAEFSSRFGQAG